MKVIYIAGPIRAANRWLVEQNIRKAEALALEVWRHGQAAICVHTHSRFFQDVSPDPRIWLDGDLELLKRCDAMLVVPQWQDSKGTIGEIEFAEKNNIPIFWVPQHLFNWIGGDAYARW